MPDKKEAQDSLEIRGGTYQASIDDKDFQKFKTWIYEQAGISLADHKKALVAGRLAPRMRHYNLKSYSDYFSLITGNKEYAGELQTAIDLLTTNETYFFREPKHFDYLREHILPAHPRTRPMRVWCAACSTGEEPYSIAMSMASVLGDSAWEIVASDLSTRVLEKARIGHYTMSRIDNIPLPLLHKHCLKGVDEHAGTFVVKDWLKRRIKFMKINLNESLPHLGGQFDVIFLRNVMIYFDLKTKRDVIDRVMPFLRKGGYLFVGHSESLNGIKDNLKPVRASVYCKP